MNPRFRPLTHIFSCILGNLFKGARCADLKKHTYVEIVEYMIHFQPSNCPKIFHREPAKSKCMCKMEATKSLVESIL